MKSTRRLALARFGRIGFGLAFLGRLGAASPASTSPDVTPTQFDVLQLESFSARARGGARGDDRTDDTAALQNWINYLVANHKRGTLGAGVYRISAPLIIPTGYEWAIDGDIAGGTRILQTTDNVPILDIGPTGRKSLMHTWRISNIEFDYLNHQPASNENANPILFSQMVCEFSLTALRFARGSYAIKVKQGIGGPWGGVWDELVFEMGLSAGAMKWTGCVNGVPNNRWGRFFVDCHNMVGPVFDDVRGYNWIIDTIEFIAAQRGAQLFSIQAGSVCTIGAIKLENGVYRNAVNLISLGPGAHVTIGQFHIGGNAMVLHPESGAITLFATAVGGPTGMFEVDTLVASATEFGGQVFVISGANGSMRVKDMSFGGQPWQICDNSATTTGDTLTIDQYKNDRLSRNLGDADYSVTLGDPNILSFETRFSSPRTLELPAVANRMFNGLYYEIRLCGAVNAENTLTIQCGGTKKFVVKHDNLMIRFVWRRNANAAAGWIMTQYEALP
ncbi:hypothetical protein [Paraburkholderia lacunae]|uniref:Pectate lyase superfamily protein domain-containing protein n=1 Tax=Paraburkholderia lacunae TaxID=2211104 RepID=A0A370N5B8_9BURK|nr:hypothetical protein [Paraburkholderia lacunae]RDK00810.1 hypothetical protein DLM46_20895 [Paraburkholderia lacunae]